MINRFLLLSFVCISGIMIHGSDVIPNIDTQGSNSSTETSIQPEGAAWSHLVVPAVLVQAAVQAYDVQDEPCGHLDPVMSCYSCFPPLSSLTEDQ